MKSPVWKMRDGKTIQVKDMGNQHLLNTIAMLERVAKKMLADELTYFPSFQGEMAQYYAEREWDALNEMTAAAYAAETIAIYSPMVKEAMRRRLMARPDWMEYE